jgi:hypothetical protein
MNPNRFFERGASTGICYYVHGNDWPTSRPRKQAMKTRAARSIRALLVLVAVWLLARHTAFTGNDTTIGWVRPPELQCELLSAGKPHSIQKVPDPAKTGEESLRFELRKGEV